MTKIKVENSNKILQVVLFTLLIFVLTICPNRTQLMHLIGRLSFNNAYLVESESSGKNMSVNWVTVSNFPNQSFPEVKKSIVDDKDCYIPTKIKQHFIKTFRNILNEELQAPDNQWVQVSTTKPRKILVLSTWRSGSSFFGQLLNQYPGTYYFFEPLKTLQNDNASKIEVMDHVLNCNCKEMKYTREKKWFLDQNFRLMAIGEKTAAIAKNDPCFDSDLMSEVCALFPIRLVKTVRFEAIEVENLMEKHPDLKVISLFRDARGIMNSRGQLHWCNFPRCSDVDLVCERYNQDVDKSIELKAKYPKNFIIVRYEDLSLNLHQSVQSIISFLGLSFIQELTTFLRNHTQSDVKGGQSSRSNHYSTYRNTQSHTFEWRYSIDNLVFNQTQQACANGLSRMGYKLVATSEALQDPQVSLLDEMNTYLSRT